MDELLTPNNSTTTSKAGIFDGASPKLTFVFGLIAGVAIVSLIGWVLSASVQLSAKNSGSNKTNGTDTAAVQQQKQDTTGTQAPGKVDIALKSTDYIRGNKNAKVTLVEYSDLECPYCQSFHTSMQQLMQDYGDKVKLVFRHFPLSFHANAQKEAEAAECVGKLGGADKYWSFVDKIFTRTKTGGTGFALTDLPKLAQEVGVNKDKFNTCLNSNEFAAKVQADIQEASGYGVAGTPTTFINGQAVEGAVPYAQLKSIVDQILAGN